MFAPALGAPGVAGTRFPSLAQATQLRGLGEIIAVSSGLLVARATSPETLEEELRLSRAHGGADGRLLHHVQLHAMDTCSKM
ncbi:MAG: hypothetical protein R3F14_23680 [Polyangiaceae bacterium]